MFTFILIIKLNQFFLNNIYINKMKNFKSTMGNFFTNKLVLYIISFLALFNVIGHMIIGNFNLVVVFFVISLLVRYFSKNMIVVLGVPLIFVNILSLNNNSYLEGFEGETKEEVTKEEVTKEEVTKEEVTKEEPKKEEVTKEEVTKEEVKKESFEERLKNKGGMHSIDYATTIEDAYDHLNSILGKDGIKNLTADTERLLSQQAQLAGSLKDMGPLIEKMGPMMEKAQEMMSNMPDTEKNGLMKNVESMLSSLKKK
jgi:hypothetical protein